jgi:hypothetical protein
MVCALCKHVGIHRWQGTIVSETGNCATTASKYKQMPIFNVPEWAKPCSDADAFKLVFKGGNHDGATAAKLASHEYAHASDP